MNTKGIKFLAVVAVMVMAFAALAVFAPAENDDAIKVYNNDTVVVKDISVYTTSITQAAFYVSEDATVKIKEVAQQDITFYVQNGVTLELDIKVNQTNKIKIVTVTGDQEMPTTSGVDGKYVLDSTSVLDTSFEFVGVSGQSIFYKAAVGTYTVSYNGSGSFTGQWVKTSNAMVGADKAFDEVPTVGAGVSVAQGQTIAVNSGSLVSNLGYGVYVRDTSGTTTSGVYYAAGNNAGTINFTGSNDLVDIKEGTVTVSIENSVVKASGAKGASFQIAPDAAGLAVSGEFKSGDLTLSGGISSTFINNGGNVTISNKIALAASTITNDKGTVTIKAGTELLDDEDRKLLTVTGAGKVVLQNPKLWATDNTTSFIFTYEQVTGLIDTTAITKVAQVKDEISTNEIAANQTFELVNNTTVFQSLTVKGILIVDEGVTLTVDEGALLSTTGNMAQIINNGKIVVKAKGATGEGLLIAGGNMVNNGTMEFTAKSNPDRSGSTFEVTSAALAFTNNGSMTFSKSDFITIYQDKFTNNGTLTLNGKVNGATTIDNKGKISINGALIENAFTAKLAKTGASVSINSMKMTTSGSFTVDNAKHYGSAYGNAKVEVGTTIDNTTIRSMTYTATLDGYKVPHIDMKGAVGITLPSGYDENDGVNVTFTGNLEVSSNFSLPKKSLVTIGNNTTTAEIDVPGTMTIDKSVESVTNANKLTIRVTGKVVVYSSALEHCIYYAAKYVDGEIATYTNLNDAIVEAMQAEIYAIEVGPITINEDVIIPAEMTIDADLNTIYIGNGFNAPAVYVNSTGRLTAGAIVINSGSIYAEDSADVSEDTITAHVVFEGVILEDDILLESLEVALAAAEPGDLIELASGFVLNSGSIVIPAGVVVDATAGPTDFVLINSNMDVNGTLIAGDQFYFVASTDDSIEIDVAGYLKNTNKQRLTPHWFTPVGVSYDENTLDPRGEEVSYFVITSLDNLQTAIYAAEDSKVTVEGKAKLGNVTIMGTEDEPAEVTFNEDVSAGVITLDNATLIMKNGKEISATFADELGSITIRGAYVGGSENKVVKIYSLGENGVYMSGPITDSDNGTYSILFEGKTGMNNAIIGWGNAVEPVVYPTITFAGDTLATGNKNQIYNTEIETDPTSEDAGIVTITGSLTADNGSKVLIIADVDVLGTLAAAEKTTEMNGTVEVEGNIFLGATQASVYDPKAVLMAYGYGDAGVAKYGQQAYKPTTNNSGAVATLAGKIVIGDANFITALAGSSIDESIIEDMKSMEIIVDGKLWLTIYGTSQYSMDGLKAPITDCTVDKIYNADGDEIADFSQKYGVIYKCKAMDLDTTGIVFITLDYKIFTVCIKTDASIKAVYIDGILMYTQDVANQFYSYRVEAGEHTVSVEPATGYTADKAYLYTEMGTILKGLKFTFNQNDCIPGTYEVVYNVAGTEKIVDPEPLPPEQVSEWTVTTILLLVLVILIAIMAVIVALRLNRS